MYKFVRDLPADFDLVNLSQDISAVLESIGYQGDPSDYGYLFVLVGDGEYESVYGGCDSVPWLESRIEQIYPRELTYAEKITAQYGSWELFSELTKLEMVYSARFWALAESYIDGEIRRAWLWDETYKLAYVNNGVLWMGTYDAVIAAHAEFCDYDSDGELYGYILDSIEESIGKVAESYGGTIDFDYGEVYFLCEVDKA